MVDTNHAFHGSIHRWLDAQSELVWASCPITENGLIRVLSQPNYRGGVKSPMEVMDILAGMKASEPWRHVFWPDDFSVNEPGALFPERIIGSKQVTDAYLAGLALKNGGRLVTYESGIAWYAVQGGTKALIEIPIL